MIVWNKTAHRIFCLVFGSWEYAKHEQYLQNHHKKWRMTWCWSYIWWWKKTITSPMMIDDIWNFCYPRPPPTLQLIMQMWLCNESWVDLVGCQLYNVETHFVGYTCMTVCTLSSCILCSTCVTASSWKHLLMLSED